MKNLTAILLCLTIFYSQNYKPGDHELLLMPTANTMEKGQSYFSDYELFWLNYTYAATNTLHLSLFSMFPIASDFIETFSVGAKYKYFDSENFKLAAYGTFFIESSAYFFGTVGTYDIDNHNINASLGWVSAFDADHTELIIMLGSKINFTESTDLLVEYTNSKTLAEFDFNGMFSIGLRFKSSNSVWEIGGFRPLEDIGGDLLLIPLLKATFFFE